MPGKVEISKSELRKIARIAARMGRALESMNTTLGRMDKHLAAAEVTECALPACGDKYSLSLDTSGASGAYPSTGDKLTVDGIDYIIEDVSALSVRNQTTLKIEATRIGPKTKGVRK